MRYIALHGLLLLVLALSLLATGKALAGGILLVVDAVVILVTKFRFPT